MKLSVIVPVLNEAAIIAATLEAIRNGAPGAEIIVADGGSIDATRDIARPRCDALIEAPRGRARQMNAGALAAHGDTYAFVHADTVVPLSFADSIEQALSDPRVVGGRFDVTLDDPRFAYRMIGFMVSLRSRISRTGTGDQAIFVRRAIFEQLGGFPEIDLCEDLDFTRRLKRAGAIACLRSRVVISARRWRSGGVVATIILMWWIRLLYLAGVSPARLKKLYADRR